MKDFEDLVRTVVTLCNPEEQERLREMEDWIVKNEVRLFKKNYMFARLKDLQLDGANSLYVIFVCRVPGFLQRDSTHSLAMCFTPRVGQAKDELQCSGKMVNIQNVFDAKTKGTLS